MSHWFTGWKFWPDRPRGPVGSQYRQVTWIRPYRPGPLRVAIALFGIAVTVLPALTAFSALLASGPVIPRLVFTLSFGLIAAGLAILVTRFFAVGVYVNDAGVRIATIRTMSVYPWRLVTDISTAPRSPQSDGDQHDVGGDVVVITLRDIGPVATPVHRRSVDFLGRRAAFEMTALAIERWWRDAGAMGQPRS
jgi:hypothetical protein